jgi:hypothetical protein
MMAEIVEAGNRFKQNLTWCLCAAGLTWRDFGELAWGPDGPCGDPARRRVTRIARGETSLTVKDLERFAELLAIPAAVLAYGTPEQLRATWATSRQG